MWGSESHGVTDKGVYIGRGTQRLKGSQVGLQTPRQTRRDRHRNRGTDSHRGTRTSYKEIKDKEARISSREARLATLPAAALGPGRASRSRQGEPWQHGGTLPGLGARAGGGAGGGGEAGGCSGPAAFLSSRGRWPAAFAPATVLPRATARAPGRTLPTSACR